MAVMTETRCRACNAVINPRWKACLACKATTAPSRPERWVDPQDPRFRDGFRAFSEWLHALRAPLAKEHPRFREAFAHFEQMDSAWLAGNLKAFRESIARIQALAQPKQEALKGIR